MSSTRKSSFALWGSSLLAVLLGTLPAHLENHDPRVDAWRQQQWAEAQLVKVRDQAQIDHLARLYKRPRTEVARHVDAAHRAGERHGLPPTLILAMAAVESSFNPAARSSYGAVGLLQVVPRHHPAVMKAIGGRERLLDGTVAIDAGAQVLAGYLPRARSIDLALRRYSGNARDYANRVRRHMTELDRIGQQAMAEWRAQQLAQAQPTGRPSELLAAATAQRNWLRPRLLAQLSEFRPASEAY